MSAVKDTDSSSSFRRVGVITQARMTSTRLPGKILKVVCGKTLLEHQLERLSHVQQADITIVATTCNATDDPVQDLCDELEVAVYRGSEDDVLSRFYEAAVKFQLTHIVRVTSDCPCLDPNIIDDVISLFFAPESVENQVNLAGSIHNNMPQGRTWPAGMDCEMLSFELLQTLHQQAKSKEEREHVTYGAYHYPDTYGVTFRLHPNPAGDKSHHRWTVDEVADFALVSKIIEHLYPHNPQYTVSDALKLVEEEHPEWTKINEHVVQKKK